MCVAGSDGMVLTSCKETRPQNYYIAQYHGTNLNSIGNMLKHIGALKRRQLSFRLTGCIQLVLDRFALPVGRLAG